MNIIRDFASFAKINNDKTAFAIGNFDGLHLGHQQLINNLVKHSKSNNLKSCLLIFEPQPKEFFLKDKAPKRIFNLRTKIIKIAKLNVDYIYIANFNQHFANQKAREFLQTLIDKAKMQALFVGDDFCFGKEKEGDVQFIKNNYQNLNLFIVEEVKNNNKRTSSTLMREFLINHQLQDFVNTFQTQYSLIGKVVHGQKLARTLNAPTANILLKNQNLALQGIYFVRIKDKNNNIYQGVAHIGTRPTVENTNKQFLEVHILNFKQDVYGEFLEVIFEQFVREITKFNNLNDLKNAIASDINKAYQYFKLNPATN